MIKENETVYDISNVISNVMANFWISVKEKLPHNNDYVLLIIKYEKYEKTDDDLKKIEYSQIVQGYYDNFDSINESGFFCLFPHLSFHLEDGTFSELAIEIKSQFLDLPKEWVTHWMPLPSYTPK